jgi:hypothetical protein
VSKSVGDLGANISQEDHKRIRQLVDIARSCNSEFEASLALTGNVNVRIRRESKKVIRIVAEWIVERISEWIDSLAFYLWNRLHTFRKLKTNREKGRMRKASDPLKLPSAAVLMKHPPPPPPPPPDDAPWTVPDPPPESPPVETSLENPLSASAL